MRKRPARQGISVRLINSIVATASRHAVLCVLLFLVLGGLGLGYTARHLAIDTDTDHLFAASLPWRQAQIAEDKNFPQFNDLIVAVVRALSLIHI